MRFSRFALELVLAIALAASVALNLTHRQSISPTLPSFLFSYEKVAGSLFVQGTWRREDGDDAYPNQTTTMSCERSTRSCLEASAVLADALLFPVKTNTLSITRWDDQVVVIRGPKTICAEEFYTVDLLSESVTGTVNRLPSCGALSAKPVRIRLIDGNADHSLQPARKP